MIPLFTMWSCVTIVYFNQRTASITTRTYKTALANQKRINMSQIEYTQSVTVGMQEQMIFFEVDYYIDDTGDIQIYSFYAEAVIEDSSGWLYLEKVPSWMHKILEDTVEDYKYEMIQ